MLDKIVTEKCHACGRRVASVNKPGLGRGQVMNTFKCFCGESWMHLAGRGRSETELDNMRNDTIRRWNRLSFFTPSESYKQWRQEQATLSRIHRQASRIKARVSRVPNLDR